MGNVTTISPSPEELRHRNVEMLYRVLLETIHNLMVMHKEEDIPVPLWLIAASNDALALRGDRP